LNLRAARWHHRWRDRRQALRRFQKIKKDKDQKKDQAGP